MPRENGFWIKGGNRICKFRRSSDVAEAHWTQEDFGYWLGNLTQSQVSAIERGHARPTIPQCRQLEKFMECADLVDYYFSKAEQAMESA